MSSQGIRAGRAYVEVGTFLGPLERGLASAQFKLRAFSAQTNAIGRGLALTGGTIASGLFVPVKLAANLEQTIQRFETMLGSASDAHQLVNDLIDMATRTPMRTTDLTEAASTLLQFGVGAENLLPILQMLGDTTGGNSERFGRMALAYGQAHSAGRLMGQDLLQMINAGFNPLQNIAARTGETMAELRDRMHDGEVTVGELTQAFADATGPGGRFFELMEKQSKTTLGRWSTAIDKVQLALIPIGQAILPILNSGLAQTSAILDKVTLAMQPFLPFVPVIAAVGVGLLAAGASMIGFSVALKLGAMALGVFSFMLGIVKLALFALFSPIGLTIAAIIGIGLAVEMMTGNSGASMKWLQEQFGNLWKSANETFKGIGSALARGDIPAAANILWLSLKAAWVTGTGQLKSVWLDFKHAFLSVWESASNAMAKGIVKLGGDFKALLANVNAGSRSFGESFAKKLQLSDAINKNNRDKAANRRNLATGAITQEEFEKRKAQISATLASEKDTIEVSSNAGQKSIENDRQNQLAAIDSQTQQALDALTQNSAAEQKANLDEYMTATANVQSELAAAQQAWKDALAAEAAMPNLPEDSAQPEGAKKIDLPANMLAGMESALGQSLTRNQQTAAVSGGFSAAAAFGFGADTLADRTAQATETTAANTARIAGLMAQQAAYTL